MAGRKNAALGFIFVTLLIDCIGLGIIIPVMPKLVQHLTGGDLSVAALYGGWLTFAYALMQFFFSPVLGGLSDRYGRRPVLLVSLFGLGIDYLFMAFAPTIAWLFVGRLIAGIGGASFTTASAYIADISEPEKRAQNFGLIGAAFGIGFIVGPVIGGLFSKFGTEVPFIAAAAFSLLNWVYGFFVVPESLAVENRRPFDARRANPVGSLLQLRKYPAIVGLIGSILLIYIAAHAAQTTWAYFTIEKFGWNEEAIGYSLGFVGLTVGIVQGGLIRLVIPKLGAVKAVYTGLLLAIVSYVLFAVASKGWMMYAFMIPYALSGISGPAIQDLLSQQVAPSEQGELQGALASLVSVTSIVGPLLMTNLFSIFTRPDAPVYFPGAPFLMGAVLALLSLVFAVRTLSRTPKEATAAS